MTAQEITDWLLSGDVSIQYQLRRDLLKEDPGKLWALQARIAEEGWGHQFLKLRKKDGHWGRGFYQPKWTSTHYTLLDLKNLGISPDNETIKQTLKLVFRDSKGEDGGINPSGTIRQSDVCINGMVLNYASYFKMPDNELRSIADFLLSQHMSDGGFNCQSNRKGAVHSSLHSTISVVEGIHEYAKNGYSYRLSELKKAELAAREFILLHRLYLSDRTGEVIKDQFLNLSYPSRWKYDILRALDYFQSAGVEYDPRMEPALEVLIKKRKKDNRWPLQAKHAGQTHFEMEKAGLPSRWNTLRALRVLKHFEYEHESPLEECLKE